MRIFSDIKVRVGPDANGLFSIQRVPIVYGDPSHIVAMTIKGNSENTILPCPMFSAYIDRIEMDVERRRDTQHVSKVSTVEREYDELTQTYGQGPGLRYDVERYMPVPVTYYFKLDCWTPNTDIKFQIFEQITPIFNPSIQLQQHSNLLDWTSIFGVWREDFIWSNRSIPQGGEGERDVMTWKFKVPGWINSPAKVKKSTLIAQIITNVFDTSDVAALKNSIDNGNDYGAFKAQIDGIPVQLITTQGNFKIDVKNVNGQDEITLLNENGNVEPIQPWQNLVQAYGQITPNITKIRLKLDPNIDSVDTDVIGGIEQDPVRQNVLIFTPDVDTLPGNTIAPITTIIDPTEVWPGNGLPLAAGGQRYLLTAQYSKGEEAAIPFNPTGPWGSVVAYPNDIIEYSGGVWRVIFDSRNSPGTNFVVNNTDSTQYMFDGQQWSYSYYGVYGPGYWRIDNIIQAPNGTTINNYE